MRRDAVAIVPAGGAARRLGGLAADGKASLTAGGRTFLERVCSTLVAEVPRVIVVAAPGMHLPAGIAGVEVIRDSRPGSGPLAAIADGCAHALATDPALRVAVLCGCDTPLVAAAVIRLLLELADATGVRWALPIVDGHPQPLVSVLATDVMPEIAAALAAGRASLRDLAASLDRSGGLRRVGGDELRAADPTLESFLDVDTAADLARVVGRLAARSPGG